MRRKNETDGPAKPQRTLPQLSRRFGCRKLSPTMALSFNSVEGRDCRITSIKSIAALSRTRNVQTPAGKSPGRVFATLRYQTILIFCSLCCSGCFPVRHTLSPGASGVILDSSTHAPIAGAEVVISHLTFPPPSAEEAFTNSRPPVVKTERGGEFLIPPERGWDLFVVPIDAFPPFGLLVVRRDGYQPALVPFWSRSVKPLGDVVMKPIDK